MPESLWAHQAAEDVSQQPDAAAGAMRDLLRSLRHDLRTPINHIVGYSELLLENAQDLGQPGLVASIQKILIAGTALLGHIGDFLDSSKANGGALDLDPLRFALRTQLNAIIGYSEMLYEETEEQGQPELAADFRRICSAGKHLLGVINAFLELSKAEAGEDAGEAAAPAGPPAGQEVLRLQPPAPPPAAEASVEPASVLVVDDNEINRDMLARRLDRLGYRVALAEHGRAALERLRAEPFDLVLLDIRMPELNGYQVLAHLKSDPSLWHIPVIVLSAMDDLDSIVRCIQLGADDYLVSPFNPDLLKARAGTSVQRKRIEDALRESERKYRELADLLPETVFEMDVAGRLTFANRAAREQFGYAQADFDRGIDAVQMVAPEDRPSVRSYIAATLGGQPPEPHECVMLRRDGSTFPALVCSGRILHGGVPVGLRGFIVDITERTRAQAQLLQQQRALAIMEAKQRATAAEERLRREIAELLHGPVQTKLLVAWFRLGQCQSLLPTDPSGARAVLDEVREELERLREQDVRQASHLLHPSIIQLGLVPAVRSLSQRFEEHFEISLQVDPGLAQFDDPLENRIPEPLRLAVYRVIEEALNNILRHAGASRVELFLGLEAERQLALTVRDNGRGFDPARVQPGLGLGSIGGRVEQVGGTWHIASAAGQGTKLSALLPLT